MRERPRSGRSAGRLQKFKCVLRIPTILKEKGRNTKLNGLIDHRGIKKMDPTLQKRAQIKSKN
jgi:hypothetical protein